MANMFGSRFLTPITPMEYQSSPAFSSHVVDASTEGVAFAFDPRSNNAITHLGFRYGARTGTPPTFIIGLETPSTTTGFPDGIYVGGGSPASATFTPPADTSWDGIWQWIALTNSYVPTLGSGRLIGTIRYSSGTIDGSNNSSFTTHLTPGLVTFPYASRNTSGTWSSSGVANMPVYGVRTASERYGRIVPNLYTTRTAATIGHRVAMLVNVPGGAGDTFKVAGIRAVASLAATTGKAPLAKIWSASSALASKTMDVDQAGRPTSSAYASVECIFDTSVTLNCGTDYYFGFEVAETTSSGILLYGTQFASADDKATDDGGAICSLATHTGSWSADATVRPWMELILEDWTEPSGGGGAFIGPMRVIQSAGRRR